MWSGEAYDRFTPLTGDSAPAAVSPLRGPHKPLWPPLFSRQHQSVRARRLTKAIGSVDSSGGYDVLGRTARVRTLVGEEISPSVEQFSLTYDANGNRATREDPATDGASDGHTTYAYDELDLLVGVTTEFAGPAPVTHRLRG